VLFAKQRFCTKQKTKTEQNPLSSSKLLFSLLFSLLCCFLFYFPFLSKLANRSSVVPPSLLTNNPRCSAFFLVLVPPHRSPFGSPTMAGASKDKEMQTLYDAIFANGKPNEQFPSDSDITFGDLKKAW
jgi:hypothetical protein